MRRKIKLNIISFETVRDDYIFVINEESNKIKKDIYKTYGRFAVMTWKNLNSKKILSKYNYIQFRKRFYKNIYELFCKLSYKENTSRKPLSGVYSKLDNFIKSLPSLIKINEFIKTMDFDKEQNKKEIIFIRLLLEIYNFYYIKYDYPLYRVKIFAYNLLFIIHL